MSVADVVTVKRDTRFRRNPSVQRVTRVSLPQIITHLFDIIFS